MQVCFQVFCFLENLLNVLMGMGTLATVVVVSSFVGGAATAALYTLALLVTLVAATTLALGMTLTAPTADSAPPELRGSLLRSASTIDHIWIGARGAWCRVR